MDLASTTTRTALGLGAALAGTAAVSSLAAERAAAITGSAAAPNLSATTTAHWHLARRAAVGATADIADQIKAAGTGAWLDKQLNPSSIPDTQVEALIAKHYPAATMATNEQMSAATGGRPWENAPVLQRVTMLRHVFGQRHLLEAMTEFFSDQIYVSIHGKGNSFILHYNEHVLRRHALGKFSDLLQASLSHPAVLVSLDNHLSTKDNPNENLGREMLELHTVGTGNYTEDDVRSAALLLTGHGVNWSTLGPRYNYAIHHTGRLKIMGWSHPNSGASSSYNAKMMSSFVAYLARHQATAARLMRRLATRFVSDNPSAELVSQMVQVYLRSDTAMAPVLKHMFSSAEFAASVGRKTRRGQELLASAMRTRRPSTFVPDADPKTSPYGQMATHAWLASTMGHGVREWFYVNGYPDTSEHWTQSAKLQAIWNAAEGVMAGWESEEFPVPSLRSRFGLKVGGSVAAAAKTLTEQITGWTWSAADQAVVASWIHNRGTATAPSTATLTEAMLEYNVPMAARLVAASPHFMAR